MFSDNSYKISIEVSKKIRCMKSIKNRCGWAESIKNIPENAENKGVFLEKSWHGICMIIVQ